MDKIKYTLRRILSFGHTYSSIGNFSDTTWLILDLMAFGTDEINFGIEENCPAFT